MNHCKTRWPPSWDSVWYAEYATMAFLPAQREVSFMPVGRDNTEREVSSMPVGRDNTEK